MSHGAGRGSAGAGGGQLNASPAALPRPAGSQVGLRGPEAMRGCGKIPRWPLVTEALPTPPATAPERVAALAGVPSPLLQVAARNHSLPPTPLSQLENGNLEAVRTPTELHRA